MAALSTWQQIAVVASPVAAAIAAGASWASVWQARRLARDSTSPFLQVQITATPERTIGALVTNAGGGMARGAVVLLAHPPYKVVGPLGHGGFLRPGETAHLITTITIIEGVRTSVIASCRDKESFPHAWSAEEEHRVFKTRIRRRPRYQDLRDVFRAFYPDVDPDQLQPAGATVDLVPG